MSQSSSNQQRSILAMHRRRLALLELRAAREGSSVDPAVAIEIEDLKTTIQQIEQSLAGTVLHNIVTPTSHMAPASLQSAPHMPTAPRQSPNSDRIPIIVAIIGLIGVVLAALISQGTFSSRNPSQSFFYSVRVVDKATGQQIPRAKVTIEVGGIAPLDDITDSNGYTRFDIDSSRAGKSGRVIVEAPQYQKFMQNIDLVQDALPKMIQLEPLP